LFDHADGVFIFTQKAQKFTERVIRRLGWDVKYDGVARNLVAVGAHLACARQAVIRGFTKYVYRVRQEGVSPQDSNNVFIVQH